MATDEPVVYYEKKLIDILKGPSLSGSGHRNQPSIPKIQRVQPYLRQRKDFEKYYFPKLLSIGPIHHDDPNLELGEEYKRRWTRAYFEDFKLGEAETEAAAKRLHQIIASNIEDLKKLYTEDAIKEYKGKDNYLAWMLVVDGCSILHIINNGDDWWNEASKILKIKIDQMALLLQDLLLLENQLPHQLLSLLTDDKYNLEEPMLKLLRNHNMLRESNPSPHSNNTNPAETSVSVEEPPAHLLDLMYKTLVRSSTSPPCPSPSLSQEPLRLRHHPQESTKSYSFRNMQELKAAGIKVKSSRNAGIEFKPGYLELPHITVNDFTVLTLVNLIAYEMCPDFHNNFEINSYVTFLDLLIDNPNDVKDLKSAGVLDHRLKNDGEVAKLFNTISTGMIADAFEYAIVNRIEKYCTNNWRIWEWSGWVGRWHNCRWTWNNWMTEVCQKYFSSPWASVGLMAGMLGFGLTMVQTWYTVWPAQSDQK